MEAEDSWQSSNAKLFSARLFRLALLAVKPNTMKINLRKYSRINKSLASPFCVIQLLLLNKFLKTVMNAAYRQHLTLLGLPHRA